MEPAGPARSRRTSARGDPRRRCGRLFAADRGRRGRHARPAQDAAVAKSSIRRSPSIAGRIVKTTGDGLLVEFASVVDALRCADTSPGGNGRAQCRRAGRNAASQFRIGIHQGDIVVEDGDIFGDGVNVAARLEGLAEPGGICVSARVQEDAAGQPRSRFRRYRRTSSSRTSRGPIRAYRVATLPRNRRCCTVDLRPSPSPTSRRSRCCPSPNMSGDPEQEYFADGMVEEIITALSRIRWFFVIARNSTFTYKGRAVDVKQVGRELGVRYVLEGSVRKSGNRIRVTAQLVEAATGNHVWAERYDRDLADIFAVQDEITERVVAAIEPELYAAEQVRSQSKPPDSLDAWECVIRALSCIGQGTRDENTEAEALCRRAIAIAPGYGRAHSLLAWALLRRTTWSGDLRTVMPEISAETRTALALDDRDPWAHFAQGNLLYRLRRFGDAARALRRALELNPNFALAHAFLGYVARYARGAPRGCRQRRARAAAEPARPACGHLCLDGDGATSISTAGTLSGVRHLGAQHDREKSGMGPGTLLSDRGAGDGGGFDRGGGGAGHAASPPAGILADLDE